MKETLNTDFIENKQEIIISSKKSKICKLTVLILSLLAIITTAVLLVAHFKYGLFDSEIYQVAEIKREPNSIEFFSETKKLKTKMTYANAESFDIEQEYITDFIVMLNDKKQNLNVHYGYLVILNSKVKAKDEQADLDSFNIFDEEIIKQFEENPDDSQFPIAEFSFYEDGTLNNVNLPKGSVSYNAEKLLDLIKGVIPKLTRNKTEDENNGIKINTRTNKKKKTFSEYEPPKEYADKFTKTNFKGSKITKLTETDIEDDKITEIRTNTNLNLETQKNGEENNGFGIDNLKVVLDSKITATKTEKNKLNVIELVDRLASKITFVDSEEVMNSLPEYKNVEQNIEKEEEKEEEEKMRNLGAVSASGYYEWVLYENKDLLGKTASASYVIDMNGGKVVNKIQVKAGSFKMWVGNQDGMSKEKDDKKKDNRFEVTLGTFPVLAYEIKIDIKLSMSLNAGISFYSNKFLVTLSGSVDLKAELSVGTLLKFTAGVKGQLIGASFTCGFKTSPFAFSRSDSKITISSGAITGYLKGQTVTGRQLFNEELKIWDGWYKKEIPLKY